jgi:thiol-disulfide isomerase/thioredoxin
MDESTLNPNRELHPEPQPEITPAPPPSTSSRLLTIGILAAAAALAVIWIRQDAARGTARLQVSGTTQSKADGPSPIKIGAPAPKLVLKDLQGNTVDLEALKGKVVIVDFWATWCEPCQIMIPWLEEFHNRYASQGLEIVGVSMDDDIKDVKPFVDKAKMNYPILFGNDAIADAWAASLDCPRRL